ncbi:MAG: transposase, partial [Acidimicrobiales bacterium]
VHTVLVDMRARLARSDRPERIFQATLEAAKTAGLVRRRRVLDSTPLYDAVATMDTVTLIRSAIRGLLKVADTDLETELRARLRRDDDYTAAGKPACDYDDPDARAGLVDALGRDAMALLGVLDGRELEDGVSQAGQLLATVVGQDLDTDDEGVFRIARKVARDRVISTVDPEARHGHKTSARGFDGYKGHIGIDPDSEIVTATTVTPGNSGDVEAAEDLLADVLPPAQPETEAEGGPEPEGNGGPAGADVNDEHDEDETAPAVYGDAAYGAGKLLARLENAGADIKTKVQPPVAPGGRFTKDRFAIDLAAGTVTCPNGVTAALQPTKHKRHAAVAKFGAACTSCPLAAQCTSSVGGRTVAISRHEAQLARARAAQSDPAWQADYKATRPKVERKIGHLMRRRHGGRRARMRGRSKVAADFSLLAAAVNVARLGVLGVVGQPGRTWVVATA